MKRICKRILPLAVLALVLVFSGTLGVRAATASDFASVAAGSDGTTTTSSSSWTLEENTVITGNLSVTSGTLDLAGYTLTVYGNVYLSGGTLYADYADLNIGGSLYQTGGTMTVEYATLNIDGDYIAATVKTSSSGTVVYSSVTAYLNMNGTEVAVNVGGDFVWDGRAVSNYYGVVTVGGNFSSLGPYTVYFSYESSLVLAGTGTQKVTVELEDSYFEKLTVENGDSRDIVWSGYFSVGTLESEISIIPMNIEIRNLDTNGHIMTVQGDATISNSYVEAKSGGNLNIEGDVNLTGGTIHAYYTDITISGNLFQTKGTVSVEYASLNIGGHYIAATINATSSGTVAFSNVVAYFEMNGAGTAVNVGGDLVWDGRTVTAYYGVLTVGGNFSSLGSYAFTLNSDSSLVLSGTDELTVKVEASGTFFEKLIVENADSREIIWSGYFGVGTLESEISIIPVEIEIQNLDTNGHMLIVQGDAVISNSYVEATNGGVLNIEGDVTVTGGTLRAYYTSVSIGGKLTQTGGTVSAEYAVIDIGGDLTQTKGTVSAEYGTVNIGGDYIAATVPTSASSTVDYTSVTAYFEMGGTGTAVNVDGDFIWYGKAVSATGGVLTVAGNFSILCSNNFDLSGTSGLVLSGNGTQTVTVEPSGTYFEKLTVKNEDSRTICWSGYFGVGTLESDISIIPDAIEIRNLDTNGHAMTVQGDAVSSSSYVEATNGGTLNIEGDVTLTGGTLQANYTDINISGSLYQTGGTLNMNNGTVKIGGDYVVSTVTTSSDGSNVYAYVSTAYLYMDDDGDIMTVGGDFIWYGRSATLTKGTLTIKGNFEDMSTNSSRIIAASGDHVTVLDGDGSRTVTFASTSAHFNILQLMNAKSLYTFSFEPCWNEIIYEYEMAYTVSFDANYTGAEEIEAQIVPSGTTATAPVLSREGFSYIWCLDGTTTEYDFDTPVRSDLELYAKWTRNTLLVTFEANGGTLTDDATQTVKYNATVSEPSNPTRVGYIFKGWYLADAAEAYDFDTRVTENVTLIAQWAKKAYSVSFDANRGQFADGTSSLILTVNYGGTASEPTAPTKTGYIFEGWYVTGTQDAYDFGTVVTGNVELYAKWTLATVTVTFNANGGTFTSGSAVSQTVRYGALVSEPTNPVYTGYDFAGWFTGTGSDAEEYDFSQVVTGDVTLYAHWTAKQWTVSFNANYTGAEEIASLTVANGAMAEEPAELFRVGYTYIWCEYGTTTAYDFDTPVTGNLELYAKWTRVSHTVTFDANGGELTGSGTISVKHNATADEPDDPTFAGYAFDGWFTEDGTLFDFGTTLITEDITLYAHWTKCEVEEPIVITSQPTDTKFVSGEKVTFTITAEGNGLSYTWYYLKAGTTTWKSWPQNTSVLSVTANSTWEGMKVYCIVTDEDGNTLQSDTITLTESTGEDTDAITITTQPVNVQAVAGVKVTFIVVAEGNDLSYTWYYKKAGSSTWGSWPQDTNTLSVTANSTWEGMQVYCLITDGDGNTLKSDIITITLKTEDEEQTDAITITVQPEDMTVTAGTKVTFTVTAEGNDLSYKWYYKKAGATEYSSWSQNTNALRVTANSTWEGMQVYCEITDADGNVVTTNVITLTVAE